MSAKEEIGRERATLERIREKLEETTLNTVRKALPDAAITRACRAVGYEYRRRLLTPVVTVLHVMMAAIWPEESFAASWQVIWDAMVSRLSGAAGQSPARSSVTRARSRMPVEAWERLFAWLSKRAQELSAPWDRWRGHRVVLLDGTCVSMPDEKALFSAFGRCNTRHGPSRYPIARLVTVALANTMAVISYALGHYGTDETTLSIALLGTLRRGDLLVADRHFAGANLYHRYRSFGLEFLTRVHQKLKVSWLPRLVSYNADDFVTDLLIGGPYRREDPTLPKKIMVRLIRAVVRIRGRREVLWLATSLLDAQRYPAREIVELYARRWKIETLFRQVKINLSADVLRSKTPDGVRKEIIGRLMAVNVVRMIILEAAIEHDVDPLRISFVHATRAVLAFAPALATEPLWKLPAIYHAMLQEIASHVVPERPGRTEPRAVTRERKHYPHLRTTRRAWRLANVA
ncbi:MAG: IS4 family transposase [Planctomycetota bacterium]